MSSKLHKLQNASINIYLDPIGSIEHLASIDDVIKVLQKFSISYNQFVIHEFLKTKQFKAAYDKNHKTLNAFSEDMKLYLTNVSLSSFEASVSPDIIANTSSMFRDEVEDWKKNRFDQYKEDFIYADYTKTETLKRLNKKYTGEERKAIAGPLLSAVSPAYNLRIKGADGKIANTILLPHKDYAEILIPRKPNVMPANNTKIIQAYFKINSNGTEIKLNKSNIKEIYDIQELEHETYPFRPDIIRFDQKVFILNKKLNCDVSFEDNLYFISYEPLNISVWAETREEAENAFNFSFISLYENFGEEKDKNLSEGAKNLKRSILNLISTRYNEGKKD